MFSNPIPLWVLIAAVTLTLCVPLSLKEEGEGFRKRGFAPLGRPINIFGGFAYIWLSFNIYLPQGRGGRILEEGLRPS